MDEWLSPPVAVWIDDRLVVGDSPIEGQGLFFTRGVRSGTTVMGLGGHIVSSAALDALIQGTVADPGAAYVDTITVNEDAHLVLPPNTLIHFGNHSCDPTLWIAAPFEFTTRRDVTTGEEATIDYGTVSGADGFRMACRCGATTCRREVTSADWRRPELQARYRGHWVPALQARIDSR